VLAVLSSIAGLSYQLQRANPTGASRLGTQVRSRPHSTPDLTTT
jgi:hypothetical protein